MLEGRKEMSLFNDTFYLWLYGIRHMVKDHSDIKRGNPLLPLHGLLFLISSKKYFMCIIIPWIDSTYHGLCHTSCGTLDGTRNSSMGPPGGVINRDAIRELSI